LKAHRRLYHLTLGSREIKKKKDRDDGEGERRGREIIRSKHRCRANLARIRQPRPDSSLGLSHFQCLRMLHVYRIHCTCSTQNKSNQRISATEREREAGENSRAERGAGSGVSTVEPIWHASGSRGQILALTSAMFRAKVFRTIQVVHFSLGSRPRRRKGRGTRARTRTP
jgi:hypothetical protein